jgi:hypothetical protein
MKPIQMRQLSQFALKFLAHLTASTILPLVAVVGTGVGAAWAFNENKIIDYLIIGPSFFLPLSVGAVLGYVFTRRSEDNLSAFFVWVVPALVLLWNIMSWRHQAVESTWRDVWNNFFGSRCSSSECIYELMTAAFVSSAAYSISAFVSSRAGERTSPREVQSASN